MEFIVISDLHINEHPIFRNGEGQNLSLKIMEDCLDQVWDYAKKVDGPVIHTGDLFDMRNKIPVNLVVFAQRMFSKCSNKIYLLKGTSFHDGEADNYNGNIFSLQKDFETFDVPTGIYSNKGFVFYFLPSVPKSKLLEAIEIFKNKTGKNDNKLTRIVFGHSALAGAKTLAYEASSDESLSKKDLDFFHFGFFGHYHKYQEVWNNFFQVGSPYRVDFSERMDPKGFIHFKDGKVKFIPLQIPDMIQIDIDKHFRPYRGKIRDAFFKFVITGDSDFVNGFDSPMMEKQFYELGALGIRCERKITGLDAADQAREIRIRKEDSPLKMLNRYVDLMEEEDRLGGLDKQRILRIGKLAMEKGTE
ncbi:MAG: metallophosphoesterase [bacterium]